MAWFRRLLFAVARSSFAAYFMGWVFTHMSFAIPVERLHETDTLLAFYHPKPVYPVHILIVPKRPLANMAAISAADTDFLVELFQTVQYLVNELNLEQGGYRLITNGGDYQDVPHLHFHLVVEA